MTQLEFFTALANGAKWGVPASISRSGSANGGLPIDAYSIFKSKADAELYASQNKAQVEAAGMVNNAYVGQIVTVWAEDDSVEVYYINSDKTLKPVGIIPTGDSKTIEVTTAGAISLLGASTAANGTLPMIDSETGKLVWRTLEDIGAGDGNDNTTYTFELSEDGTSFVVTPLFNGQPIYEGEGEEKVQVKTTISLDVYTKKAVDDAIKVLADKIGVQASDGVDATGLYELIANEVARATEAEGALSDRIGVAKDGEAPATGVYAYVDGVVQALVEGVDPEKIDSLNELIAWVEAHPDIVSGLDARLDRVEGILEGFGPDEEDPNKTVKAYVDAKDEEVKDYVDTNFATKDIYDTVNNLSDAFDTHAENAEKNYAKKDDVYTKTEIDTKIGVPGTPEETDEDGNVTKEAVPGTGVYQHVYSKAEVTDLIAEITGGESAADVKAELKEYKTTNDTRVKNVEDKATANENKLKTIEENAEVNIIETVKVNGVALTPDADRAVNVTVPVKVSDLSDGSALELAVSNNTKDIDALEVQIHGGKVGDETIPGVVSRLAVLEDEVGTVANSRIDALEGTVGNHTKTIGEHTSALTTLNAETIPGLEQTIGEKAAQTEVDNISDAVDALNETVYGEDGATGLVKDVADLKVASAKHLDANGWSTEGGVLSKDKTSETSEDAYTVTLAPGSVSVGSYVNGVDSNAALSGDKLSLNTYADDVLKAVVYGVESITRTTGEETPVVINLPTASGDLALVSDIPTAVSGLTNDAGYQNATEVANAITEAIKNKADRSEVEALDNAIKAVLDNEGGALDSIKELATWVEEHETEVLPVIEQQGKDIVALQNKVDVGDMTVSVYVAGAIETAIGAIPEYELPIATALALGGIKSAADVEGAIATNKVYVDATSGIGEVKAVSTDLLVQGSATLILNGGNADLTA